MPGVEGTLGVSDCSSSADCRYGVLRIDLSNLRETGGSVRKSQPGVSSSEEVEVNEPRGILGGEEPTGGVDIRSFKWLSRQRGTGIDI